MKKTVLVLLGLLLVFSALAIAQGYETMPADAKIIPLGQAGIFYCATISNPKKWNDVTAHETSTTQYTGLMLEGLISTNPVTVAIEPELAKSWDVSEDGLTITFHLRQGLKYVPPSSRVEVVRW